MIIVLDLPEPLSVPFHLLGDSSLECSQTPFTNFDHVDYVNYDKMRIMAMEEVWIVMKDLGL